MRDCTLVLVTRTRPGGRVLAERLQERGLDALECAPYELEGPERPRAVAEELLALLPADRVILTSQEAVRRAVELAGPEAFARALVIVPGEGTASVARDCGLDNVIYPERHGTSEAVLGMPELRDVEGLDVLILAAAGGRGLIGETLMRRGAEVERLHVYRRVARPLPDGMEQRILEAPAVITLAASQEAVTGLCDGLEQPARERLFVQPLVAPSERVARHAARLGFRKCSIAGGADNDAMLAELDRLA
jgi:uroporphyrinogen-III synthase